MDDFEEVKGLIIAQGGMFTSLSDRLTAVEKKMGRPGFGTGGSLTQSTGVEERKALAALARTGDDRELKAHAVGSDPDGGYLVQPYFSAMINAKLWDVSPLARLARKVQIASGDAFEEPIDADDMGATWVGEQTSRPATDTPELAKIRIPVQEIYANPLVTQRLLDDSQFDVGAYIEDRIAAKFARSEGGAFVAGNGVARPRGILTYGTATTADGARAWGTIQYVPTGHASTFITPTTTASPVDCLVDLSFALRAPYRTNARWLMNRTTAGVVRKFKDPDGRFVWTDASAGQPATLLGFPVELDEEFPNIGAGEYPIAFGDFGQAYVVVERPGLRMLRDPYSSKPHVMFYAYRRVGGGVQNSEAVKLLKVAAS
jgi:HK97 family phage major capsid protein